MSGGDLVGGWASITSKTFGAGDASLLERPVCSDVNFPGRAGGGDRVKLLAVGVVPK